MQPKQVIHKTEISDEKLAQVGLKMFFRLTDTWKLSSSEQGVRLGVSSRQTILNRRKKAETSDGVRVSRDTLDRLSLFVGIRKAIEVLYPKDRWDSCMKAPNRRFGGQSPLDRMLEGSMKGLYDVREYLDAARGAHFG